MESSYIFNEMGRKDVVDMTQKNVSNTRYANYVVSSPITKLSESHIKFATQQPVLVANGVAYGKGLSGDVIDVDSLLHLKTVSERSYDKLQLMQRTFATVPFLGKGFSNPSLESQLLFGESNRTKQSASISQESFNYTIHPTLTSSPIVMDSRSGLDTRFNL